VIRDLDLLVIGAGPAGYYASIHAAKAGLRTALVEKEFPGGTCLNWGCIPTKTLHRSAKLFRTMLQADQFGIRTGSVQLQPDRIFARKNEVVEKMRQAMRQNLQGVGVRYIEGSASLLKNHMAQIQSSSGERMTLSMNNTLIATGSRSAKPNIPGIDLPGVHDSRSFLEQEEIPKSIIVIGGGVIGMEFASILKAFVKVHICIYGMSH